MMKHFCDEFGLYGFVWREPVTRGRILVRGTEEQIKKLFALLSSLRHDGFFDGWNTERRQDFDIIDDSFVVKPSFRPKVKTEDYSDRAMDDVVSTNSADKEVSGFKH